MYVTRYQRICVDGQSLDGATTVDCAINRYKLGRRHEAIQMEPEKYG